MKDLQKILKDKIEKSIILKKKLTDKQIEKFLKKALELPREWQKTLVERLTKDEWFFEKQREEQIKIVSEYNKKQDEELEKFNKIVRFEKEKQEWEKDIEIENRLINELKYV